MKSLVKLHSCIPSLAGINAKVKLCNCRTRGREDVSVSVRKIHRKELPDIYAKGYDMLTEIPEHDNFNTRMCKEGRNFLGTGKNSEESMIFFWKMFDVGQVTPAFFESMRAMTQEKEFLFSLGKIVNIYLKAKYLLF
jgi:hypothetical protein